MIPVVFYFSDTKLSCFAFFCTSVFYTKMFFQFEKALESRRAEKESNDEETAESETTRPKRKNGRKQHKATSDDGSTIVMVETID